MHDFKINIHNYTNLQMNKQNYIKMSWMWASLRTEMVQSHSLLEWQRGGAKAPFPLSPDFTRKYIHD